MVLALVERDLIFQADQFAVDTRPREAMLSELFHLLLEFAFAAANDGRENHDTIFRSQRHHPLNYLSGGLA